MHQINYCYISILLYLAGVVNIVKKCLIVSDKNCTDEDYKFWSPSSGNGTHMPCVLGLKETYQRRIPHSKCFNGRDYDRPIKMEVCECAVEDYDW
jgi:hypothetical protein